MCGGKRDRVAVVQHQDQQPAQATGHQGTRAQGVLLVGRRRARAKTKGVCKVIEAKLSE